MSLSNSRRNGFNPTTGCTHCASRPACTALCAAIRRHLSVHCRAKHSPKSQHWGTIHDMERVVRRRPRAIVHHW
jgi:hypothetical protein